MGWKTNLKLKLNIQLDFSPQHYDAVESNESKQTFCAFLPTAFSVRCVCSRHRCLRRSMNWMLGISTKDVGLVLGCDHQWSNSRHEHTSCEKSRFKQIRPRSQHIRCASWCFSISRAPWVIRRHEILGDLGFIMLIWYVMLFVVSLYTQR